MASALTAAPPVTESKATKPARKWTFKYLSLKLHLWIGLGAGVLMFILGFTGTIIAFEQEIPRWTHQSLFYVHPAGQQLPEAQLIANAQEAAGGARIRNVLLSRWPTMAQIMQVPNPDDPRAGMRIFVDPYTGKVLGTQKGQMGVEKFDQFMHNTHLRVVQSWGDNGKLIVSIVGAILIVESTFGLILWFRLKRWTIKFRQASWFRVFFDAHNVLGIFALVLMLVLSITGVFIGFPTFEELAFKMTKSDRLVQRRLPQSTIAADGSKITVDQAIGIARAAMPEGTPMAVDLPGTPKSGYMVRMRTTETEPTAFSWVLVDQYNGNVLGTQKFHSSAGYVAIRYNRSIHTGDLWGLPGHIITSLTSLALVVLAITGVVIWWKKLAV